MEDEPGISPELNSTALFSVGDKVKWKTEAIERSSLDPMDSAIILPSQNEIFEVVGLNDNLNPIIRNSKGRDMPVNKNSVEKLE